MVGYQLDDEPNNYMKQNTLPETNSSPLKIGLGQAPKGNDWNIPKKSIFRCHVGFREGRCFTISIHLPLVVLGFQICECVYVLISWGKTCAIRFGDLWGEHVPEAFWKLPPTIHF